MTAVSPTEPGKFASPAGTVNPFFSPSVVRSRLSGLMTFPLVAQVGDLGRPAHLAGLQFSNRKAVGHALPVAETGPVRTLAACFSG